MHLDIELKVATLHQAIEERQEPIQNAFENEKSQFIYFAKDTKKK